jgi:light-harvesting complex I chlorophyll a/b binding protein 1
MPKFPMHRLATRTPWRIYDEQVDQGIEATQTGTEELQEPQMKEAMLAVAGSEEKEEFDGEAFMKTMPGGFALAGFPGQKGFGSGFFDPWRFCSQEGITEGKVKFFREAELKHARVGMLASLGFVVGENYHPLFGGNIDVPSLVAFQASPLQTFWPAVVAALAIIEVFSIQKINGPDEGPSWTIRDGEVPGDYGFDPLGLKPTDPEALFEMQNLELSTGRLAMVGAIGMIVQELKTGEKLF